MTATVSIHPLAPLEPGHYLLDREGRLHPLRYRGFIKAVARVTVKAKAPPSAAERIRADCAQEAKQREDRSREAARLTTAHPLPVPEKVKVAPERATGRRAKPTPVHVPREVLRQRDEGDEAMAEFTANLARRRAERARQVTARKEPLKVDGAKLAAAIRARGTSTAPAPRKTPTRRAASNEGCAFCGIPGARGCDHFLPFVAEVGR